MTEHRFKQLGESVLKVDCTGDETLWVFRYCAYLISISGMDLGEALPHANAAFEVSGSYPEHTPEEVASSDYAEMIR